MNDKLQKSQLIYGLRPAIEAIKLGSEIDRIFLQNGLSGALVGELRSLIKESGLRFQFVPIEKLNKMSNNANHQGVVLEMSIVKYHSFINLLSQIEESGRVPAIIMLDHITDVRNFGAIARTAECAGFDTIVIPSQGNAPVNEDAIKTSSGALLRIPICRENNLKTVLNFSRQSGLQICACSEKGSDDYTSVDFTRPTILIMGSEETGIGNDLLRLSDVCVKLPIKGQIQSLNVSVAAGVFMYETLRQRRLK